MKVSPKARLYGAYVLLVATLIGWPVSAFTWAKDEPQFILGLSWLAITITALDVAFTADVRVEQQEQDTKEGVEPGP